MPDYGKPLEITFAPGAIDAILKDRDERRKADEGGYNIFLGEMDVATAALGHAILYAVDVDHASPAGFLAFRNEAVKNHAIGVLEHAVPGKFLNRWPITSPPQAT